MNFICGSRYFSGHSLPKWLSFKIILNYQHFSIMKKTSFFLLTCLLFACEKIAEPENSLQNKVESDVLYHSVTPQEYQQASALQKRFINQVDAAVNSIDILSKDNKKIQYEAIITLNRDAENTLANSLIVGLKENSVDDINSRNARMASPDGECHVCGLRTAYACIREVEEYMDKKHKNSVSATIARTSDGCVHIHHN